jgi:2-methylisocitrate lyase-like PEP mutase family enzyme
VAPGIFDMISAKLADGLGFECLYGTGFGTVASHLGVADAGIATYTDMVARMGQMARGVKTPMIADADTGYGGLLNVRHTVAGYEAAGLSGIQLEDQEMPKKCGHTPGRRVIPAEEMVLKIKVAAEVRRDPNFLIVARTDARTTLGLEEAIRRGRLYGEAGADIVFIESPESEAEMREIGRSIAKPLLANMVEGGRTPILPAAKLAELGYAIAIYPAVGFLAAAAALERAYAHLKATGDSIALGESYGFKRMTELMGFPEVWEFEARWAQKDAAE